MLVSSLGQGRTGERSVLLIFCMFFCWGSSWRSWRSVYQYSVSLTPTSSFTDPRQLPDVALTGKCTRECDEFGHSDTCWMPVQVSPRRHPGNEPHCLSTFASPAGMGVGGDSNNNNEDGEDSEPDADDEDGEGSERGGSRGRRQGQRRHVRDSLANGDPLGDRNSNVGDHNRNLLNRKMTSASYDTFSSAGFGRSRLEEEEQRTPEVIPLTRTGGDYKTTSCLTLSRREVYL